MKLEEKISTLRKNKGLSQEELAFELGVTRQAVSKWETGASIPDLENIIKMSDLFEVTTDYLLIDETLQAQAVQEEAESHEICVEEIPAEKIAKPHDVYDKKISLFSMIYWIGVAVLYLCAILFVKGGRYRSGLLWLTAFFVEFSILAIVRAIIYKPIDEMDKKKKIKEILGDITGAYVSFVCLRICKANLGALHWDKTAMILMVAVVVYSIAFFVVRIALKSRNKT